MNDTREENTLRLPAHEFLDQAGIPYERGVFPSDTPKGAANVAHALGYEEAQMVKTLIFETGDGERVLVLVGGDRSAVSGHLKKAIGSRNIKMGSLEAVRETTGYEVGSVPPFHWQPAGFRSFVDAALMEYEVLGVGAGVWGEEILLAPEDLVKASRALVVNLTEKGHPVFLTMAH